jgi:hypothetical protein
MITNGFYAMGSLIKCPSCYKVFSKIICPSCKRINNSNNKFKFGIIKCGYENCGKESNMINCIFCLKINIFDLNIFLNGLNIKCGYCKNNFNKILCPFCREINVFPLADFSFGKVYQCQYVTCMKKFQYIICPKCLTFNTSKHLNEGLKTSCAKCKVVSMNLACPFCKSNTIILDESFKKGRMIKCPNEKCGKKYSFITCSFCEKLVFSKENESFFGKAVKCTYPDCRKHTLVVNCLHCKSNNIFSGCKRDVNDGETIKCHKCQQSFIFSRNNEIYSGNIQFLKEIEGKTIDFGKGEIDEKYLFVEKLFSNFNKNKKPKFPSQFKNINHNGGFLNNDSAISQINKPLKGCIICHNNIKESIFFPCGHRCTCYSCAVITFTVFKKCPKCKENAICIIKKVYE